MMDPGYPAGADTPNSPWNAGDWPCLCARCGDPLEYSVDIDDEGHDEYIPEGVDTPDGTICFGCAEEEDESVEP